jgi:hypothetical protein
MTDQMASLAWIKDQLTRRTIQFVDAATRPQIVQPASPSILNSAALPEPPAEIRLSAPVSPVERVDREPVVRQLRVEASPADVRHGQVLRLHMDYAVEATAQAAVMITEVRTLLLDGDVLPGYPKSETHTRGNGTHASVYEQLIPSRARTAAYLYRGEVCIAERCSRQETIFRVVP